VIRHQQQSAATTYQLNLHTNQFSAATAQAKQPQLQQH
jgi:hypothetical protein